MILIVFLVLLFRSHKTIKHINHSLLIKNKEVETKNEILNEQQEQILKQNKKILEQHEVLVRQSQDLEDSLYFAADLQRAMLSDLDVLSLFFSEWFIFYKPRDIVSGDLYFIQKLSDNEIFIIRTVDCTGTWRFQVLSQVL